MPDVVSQRLKVLVDRAGGIAFYLAIASHEGNPERGQDRAAAALAAGLPRDRRLPADAIRFIDEIPRARGRLAMTATAIAERRLGVSVDKRAGDQVQLSG